MSMNGELASIFGDKFVGLMTVPHGNADTERLFSHLNNIKSSVRSQLQDSTLKASLMVKSNNNEKFHS